MKWLNKIFTKKVYDDVKLSGKFKDAVETSTLVVSGNVATTSYNATVELEKSLTKLTKNQLVEFAQSEHGMELDRRLTKQSMIDKILEEK